MYLNKEIILRKNPNLKSEIIDILDVNSKVEVLNEEYIENKEENETYAKIKVNDIEGYGILSSLSKEKVKIENKEASISKENKIKLLKEAFKILNQNTSYSAKRDYRDYENGKTRLNGYYNIPYYENGSNEEYFSYDCSSFCDAILNRTFNIDMKINNSSTIEVKMGLFKPNLWVTKTYYDNAILDENDEKKILKKVQLIEKHEEEINTNSLEIGDFIVGLIDYENEKHNKKYIMNHIMMYVGDSYVVHASFTDGKVIFNRVLLTKMVDDLYTRLSFNRRFDKAILIARYIEK